ncbi:MAG TPA: MAPEG family protein [Myxococcota bacterium]|nr:MAPEG family protein [Myxococcota bacterium]
MNAPLTELLGLVAAAALGLVHIVLAAQSASLQRGYRWTAGPRDEPLPPLAGVAGRLARANANYLETFPFFAAAIVAVLATGTHSAWSKWGVILYLGGRLAYLPLYAAGVFLIRSMAWNVALAGITAVYLSLFA